MAFWDIFKKSSQKEIPGDSKTLCSHQRQNIHKEQNNISNCILGKNPVETQHMDSTGFFILIS